MAVRRSPAITNLRQRTAYVNFPSPLTPSRAAVASSAIPAEVTFERKAWETIEEGFGSRHLYDSAPFTLWDKEKQDFRLTIVYMENTLYPEKWRDVRYFTIIGNRLFGTT